MEIELTTDKVKLSDEQLKVIADKLDGPVDKLLADFGQRVKTANLTVEKRTSWGYKLKFSMWLPKKEHIFADTVDENFQTAVVKLREKLERQIKHYKEKLAS